MQAQFSPLTFDEFVAWYPERSEVYRGKRYCGSEKIESFTLPDLDLTAEEIFTKA